MLSAAAPPLPAAASSRAKNPAQDPSAHLVASASPGGDLRSSRYRQTWYGWDTPGGDSQVGPWECWAPRCWAPCCDLASCSINTRRHALLYIICCTPLPGEKAREQTCARRSSRCSRRLLRFHRDKHRRGAVRSRAGHCCSLLRFGQDLVCRSVLLRGQALPPSGSPCEKAGLRSPLPTARCGAFPSSSLGILRKASSTGVVGARRAHPSC